MAYLDIARGGIQGCCAGSNFFNLGAAHSHPRARTLEDFADKIITKGYSRVNIAITNSMQGKEREYLSAIGFKEVHHGDNLWIHAASYSELDRGLKTFRESREKRMQEERLKKLEEARQREARERERLLAQGVQPAARATTAQIYRLRVFSTGQPTWGGYRRWDWVTTKENICKYYGIEGVYKENFPTYQTDYDVSNVVRAVNYRLKKAGRIL